MTTLASLLADYRRTSARYADTERALHAAEPGSAEYRRLDRRADRALASMNRIARAAADTAPTDYADLALLAELFELYTATMAGVRALARVALALAELADDRELALRPALAWLAADDDGASAWTPPASQTATAIPAMGRA